MDEAKNISEDFGAGSGIAAEAIGPYVDKLRSYGEVNAWMIDCMNTVPSKTILLKF